MSKLQSTSTVLSSFLSDDGRQTLVLDSTIFQPTSPSLLRMSDQRIKSSVFLFDHNLLQYFWGYFCLCSHFWTVNRCITMAGSIPKMGILRKVLTFS
ncbi:hypothetical protein SASPL_142468 [Salvia splendens]|uniref:Uncharacterized protein n=1 Tax=Salvia splendens TaxID=180675 RepID=A0A8X8WKQ7_SALSN|nr:hypothetical protein SASPL_142468 [Salvia splendens]